MYQSIRIADAKASRSAAVAIGLFDKTKSLPAGYKALDAHLGGALSEAIKRSELSTARGAVTALYPEKGAARAYIVGLGDGERASDAVRIAGAKLVNTAFSAGLDRISVMIAPALAGQKDADSDACAAALGEGVVLGNFEFVTFRGTAGKGGDKNAKKAAALTVDVESKLFKCARQGAIVAESQNLTRTLASTPPNVANPVYLGEFCRKMAREVGLTCEVIDAKKAKRMGMGGLCAVGAGGSTPPVMIVMQWKGRKGQGPRAKGKNNPQSAIRNPQSPILLVGKAVTFDTGGYSLKPSDSQTTMKYDKCGGAAVIGAMHAIAKLKLAQPVTAIIASAENLVDREAYRVQDIIKFYNGVTCEVTNTDAEGRLVLADALSYGCKTFKPRAVIDLATLTGGVVVALGSHMAGAFVNDAKLREHLFDAAEYTGERLWHLPLWEEHRDQMRGHHADLINSSPVREASPIQGAAFLSFFVAKDGDFKKKETVPWAHIDIAGTADRKGDGPLYQRGATGYGVRLLVRAVETWK
ncbi:MAG: leucyl aminopeptidase [Phycisphaeraceae bacterium]